MALFTRFTQKLFGSSAAAGRLSQYGSLNAGSPVTYSGATASPSGIQALTNFAEGMDGSLAGSASTTPIQDMNSLHFLETYQLAYLLQQGVAEYDASTAYALNSLVVYQGAIWRPVKTATPGVLSAPVTSDPYGILGTSQWTLACLALNNPPTQFVVSGSSNGFTTSSNSFVAINNMTTSIIVAFPTTAVLVSLIPTPGESTSANSNASYLGLADSSAGTNGFFVIVRTPSNSGSGSTVVAFTQISGQSGALTGAGSKIPPSLSCYDLLPSPTFGGSAVTYTYTVFVETGGSPAVFSVNNCSLMLEAGVFANGGNTPLT